MKLVYQDKALCVCIKPAGVLSTDEPGGVPSLARKALKGGNVWTVHRLDRVVGGLMVLARAPKAASTLSEQIREGQFEKTYLAVVHGCPPEEAGHWTDLLLRDTAERKTYLTEQPQKGAQEARLEYRVLGRAGELSLVRIHLETGRTHQIRAQFSGHGFPLVGDKKYGLGGEECDAALWSYSLAFAHPATAQPMTFTQAPPRQWPWTEFWPLLRGSV